MKKLLFPVVALVLGALPAFSATVTASSGNVNISNISLLGTAAFDDMNTDAGTNPLFEVFQEKTVSLTAPDAALISANNNAAILGTTAASGSTVTSFLFAMLKGQSSSSGSLTFSEQIVGIFTDAGHNGKVMALQNTDPLFGVTGVTYDQPSNPTFRGALEQSSESITVSGNTVTWTNLKGGRDGLEQFRVLVDTAAIPLPAAFPLLVGGLAGLGLIGRRRRRS